MDLCITVVESEFKTPLKIMVSSVLNNFVLMCSGNAATISALCSACPLPKVGWYEKYLSPLNQTTLVWWHVFCHHRALSCPYPNKSQFLHPDWSLAQKCQSQSCLSSNSIHFSHPASSHTACSQLPTSPCSRVSWSGQQCLPQQSSMRTMAIAQPGASMAEDKSQCGWADREGNTEPGNSQLVCW